ncbi:MAG TPA: hypothetical protein P5534_11715 [Candidatus Paceibacterota bacterium]|nr:hypothetical protein [Candidatus Paceibacterota bacterium]
MQTIIHRRARHPAVAAWCAAWGCLVAPLAPLDAAVVGQWDFTNGLSASVGIDLDYFDGVGAATESGTTFGTSASFGIPDVAGQAVHVIRTPKMTPAMGYLMNPNAAGNGGGWLVNQYSLVFDVYFPAASSGQNRCLIQIDDPWVNSNEGEFYVAANNGLGTLAHPHGIVAADAWHRLVVTADLAASPPVAIKYVDGVKVGEETLADGLDGRWALGTSQALLFTDNAGGFDVAYINSVQVHDAVLSPGYVAALGAPSGDAIPPSVVPVAVVSAVRPAANDAFVLPGTVIEADLLAAGQAIPADSIQMAIDGTVVSHALAYPSAGMMRVSYDPGVLAPESHHTVRVSYVDPVVGTDVQHAEWSFRMSPFHLAPPDPAVEGLLSLSFEEPATLDGGAVSDGSPADNDGIFRLQPDTGDLKVAGPAGYGIDLSINRTLPQNYVELTHGFGATPNTFAAWVKVASDYPAGDRVGVIVGTYPVANAINWEIHSNGRPRVYWGYSSGALVDWIVNDDLRTGQWEHLAFVRDPVHGFHYYRNGRLGAVLANAGPSVVPAEAPYVGSDRRASGFQPFRGALDEIAIFERALGSNEVFRLYTAGVDFPKYLFAAPPIARVAPTEGATGVGATPTIEVQIDESLSSNTVDLASVQLTLNGVALAPQATRSDQTVLIAGAPTSPLIPASTNTARVRYLDQAPTPHETVREWSFVTGPAPVILWMSSGATVAVGDDVTLGVRAAGLQPLSYQWRADGVPIADATSAVLALGAVTVAQAGAYDVVVGSPSGAVSSPVAVLTVLSALPLGGLLNDVTAHYAFETHVDGVVGNEARAAGYAGFARDEALLNGAEGDPSALMPPFTTAPGKARAGAGALDCDGIGDYGDILGSPVLIDWDWTVSAWFKPDTGGAGLSGTTRAFVFETAGSAYPISFGLRAGTSGNSNFQIYSDYASGTDPYRDFQVPNADVDRWHHIAIVYRSAAAAIEGYLDGTLTHQIPLSGAFNTSWSGFRVGTYRSANGRWFKGQVDEVALWQRALSTDEIAGLFTAGDQSQTLAARIGLPGGDSYKSELTAYYDFDARTDWVVANRAPAVGGTGFFPDDALTMYGGAIDPAARIYPLSNDPALARAGQGALSCDGTDDYAHIIGDPFDPNQNWSAAAWFKPDTGGLGVTDAARLFVFESTGANYTLSFGLRAGTPDPDTGDPRTDFQIFTVSAAGAPAVSYPLANSLVDQWHHIVITYDAAAGVMKGYLDGSPTHTLALGPDSVLQDYSGLNIGTYRAADGRWFAGWIDEVSAWQRTLSPGAVAQAYAMGSAGESWLTGGPPRIIAFAPAASPQGGWTLTWQAVVGRKYDIEASNDLEDWSDVVADDYAATAATASIVIVPTQPPPANGFYDAGLSGASHRFYRVRWN